MKDKKLTPYGSHEKVLHDSCNTKTSYNFKNTSSFPLMNKAALISTAAFYATFLNSTIAAFCAK